MVDEKAEEDSYSVIFSSLRHPIRRKILRMLKDKPLTFSEILASLSIDSGHLSYHLESLGDLVTRTAAGKYALSTIGVAAVRLMGGVEEHEIRPSSHGLKLGHVIERLNRAVLVGTLLVISLYFLTYTTQQYSLRIGEGSWLPTSPIAIAPGQTLKFNITVEYANAHATGWTFREDGAIEPITPLAVIGEGGFGTYNYTFQRSVPTITPSVWETGFLKFGITLNQTNGGMMQNNSRLIVLSPFTPPNVQVTVHKPDGTVTSVPGVGIASVDFEGQHGFFGLTSISTEGTYTFEIKNNDTKELDAFLTPIAEWQLVEKPYFYYGIAGLIIAAIYPVFILARTAYSRFLKKQHVLHIKAQAFQQSQNTD